MLLPIPAKVVRDISLENHLALATMQEGYCSPDTMISLLRILYITYYLLEKKLRESRPCSIPEG